MAYQFKKVTPSHQDFIALVDELNLSLNSITSDSGEASFVSGAFNPEHDGCLLVYHHNKPVACGVFRFHAYGTCELKRMYSKQKGAGSALLEALEGYAIEKGYSKAVLSTRSVNENAIGFYRRHGFGEIEAYGKYIGLTRSICMGKALMR